MKFISIYSILICLLMSSCNSKSDLESNVKVTLKAKVSLNDKFQLFYSDSYIDNYTEQSSQVIDVKSSEEPQEITFEVPNRFVPNRIRIDFGNQVAQKEIQLEEIRITAGNKSKSFKANEILTMFEFNKYAEYDSSAKKLSLKTVEEMYDPFLISKNLQPVFRALK